MYGNLNFGQHQSRLKREQACSDNLCRRKVRREDRYGDNQEYRESLLCKINLC